MEVVEQLDLRRLRQKAGLTVNDVADKLGKSRATICNWESGYSIPSLTFKRVYELCKLYRCSIKDLADASEQTMKANKRYPYNLGI